MVSTDSSRCRYVTLSLVAQNLAIVLAAFLFAGCVTVPYELGGRIENDGSYVMPEGEPQFERGNPHWFLDASDWIWPGSWLGKLLLWNYKVDSHELSPDTENTIKQYIAANDLKNVKVRLNQYRPGGEWKRLFKNKSVGAGWRYTLGILSTVYYTIFPGRFFGGDNYNPYTHTINIYSDIPAVALHEGGHAKDFTRSTYKGTYAFFTALPLVPLYSEAIATNDAVSYLRAERDFQGEKGAYNILYPAYGTHLGGNAAVFFPKYRFLISAAAAVTGHIVGRIRSGTLDPEDQVPSDEEARPTPVGIEDADEY